MLFRGIFDFTFFVRASLVLAIAFLVAPAPAFAFDIDALRQRLENRQAELQSRFEDIDSPSVPTPTPTDTTSQDEEESVPCGCSASIGFSKPSIQWKGNTLEFIPRFDVSIRIRAKEGAEGWHLHHGYEGTAHNTSFSGAQDFGGQCFDGRYKYSGLAGTPVPMSDIVRSLFGVDDELETNITMRSELTGCDEDTEARQMKLTVEELGNLKIRGWRSWKP